MLKIMKECWHENEAALLEALRNDPELKGCSYRHIVEITFENIFNRKFEGTFGCNTLNLKKITEINDGDYQGTLLFLIPFDTYQPCETEYLMTSVSYGSCSGCDTLQNIQDCFYNRPEEQLKMYMQLCKDIICSTVKPYNYGWREDERFSQVEMEAEE